tara:strand:+ start:92 stop:433 length:342 start_codon:yes stop_codon:yes gene_type:complete
MKKLLLVLALATTLLSNAQKKFSGSWKSTTSSYTTTILANEYKVLKIFNHSLVKSNFIEETIVSQNKDTIKTKLFNPQNSYSVNIKYYLKNKNTLINLYTGDYNKLVLLTRVQ